MKISSTKLFILLGTVNLIAAFAFNEMKVSGNGTSIESASFDLCRDEESIHQQINAAEAKADIDAEKKCAPIQAVRLSKYERKSDCYENGAKMAISVTATYNCKL